MSSLLIFGASGHGRVVADAALRAGVFTAVAATDRDPARCHGELLPGVSLRSCDAALARASTGDAAKDVAVHVAIGDNTARAREARAIGLDRLVQVLHPQASVSPHASLAPGCFVAAQAVIAPLARLEMGVIVNHGAVIDHDGVVGAFSHLGPGATLAGGSAVGAGVLVGAGARVLPGVTVCDGAVIGAGAVVHRDITEPGTYVGIPARRIS